MRFRSHDPEKTIARIREHARAMGFPLDEVTDGMLIRGVDGLARELRRRGGTVEEFNASCRQLALAMGTAADFEASMRRVERALGKGPLGG